MLGSQPEIQPEGRNASAQRGARAALNGDLFRSIGQAHRSTASAQHGGSKQTRYQEGEDMKQTAGLQNAEKVRKPAFQWRRRPGAGENGSQATSAIRQGPPRALRVRSRAPKLPSTRQQIHPASGLPGRWGAPLTAAITLHQVCRWTLPDAPWKTTRTPTGC